MDKKYKKMQFSKKETSPFEKLVKYKSDIKVKKTQNSKQIIDPKVTVNHRNNLKIGSSELQPNIYSRMQKQALKLFQLDSEDEQEQQELKNWRLTHNGKQLDGINDYKENIDQFSSFDEQDNKDLTRNHNFSGFDINKGKDNNNQKTKAEIYQDIIKNSKIKRQDKLRLKEDQIAKLQELNDVFPLIAEHLLKTTQKDEYNSLAQIFKQDEKVMAIETIPREKTQRELNNISKMQQRRKEQIRQLEDSELDNSPNINDDLIQKNITKSNKEMNVLKGYKKVHQLTKMMECIRNQRKKNNNNNVESNQISDELDEIEESDQNDEYQNESDQEESNEKDKEQYGSNQSDEQQNEEESNLSYQQEEDNNSNDNMDENEEFKDEHIDRF